MNALNHKYEIATLALIILMAISGCQGVAKEQPTAIPVVVVEREANCPIIDFKMESGTQVLDPEIGGMERGALVSWHFDCPEPYLKGKWVGIQDFYSPSEDTYYWNSIYEAITEEGGVWKTTTEVKPPLSLSTCIGEGKYKGLRMTIEGNLDTNNFKIRVTRLVGE